MPTISHSEVESYALCRRKHYYGYTLSLESVHTSAMSLGSAGHSILEAFYKTVLAAGNTLEEQLGAWDVAKLNAQLRYEELAAEDKTGDNPKKADLHDMIFKYYLPNEGILKRGSRILAVEKEFNLEYDTESSLNFPFVVDLLVMNSDNNVVVIDHKFMYDFISAEQSQLQPQIPKYIGALRALGYKVSHGEYNMVRTRLIRGEKLNKAGLVEAICAEIQSPDSDYDKPVSKMTVAELEELATGIGIEVYTGPEPDQMVQVLPVKPNVTRVERTFREQVGYAAEIQSRKLLTPEDIETTAYRTASKMVCQSCVFRTLCESELMGGNSALVMKSEFKTRERKQFFEISEEVDAA